MKALAAVTRSIGSKLSAVGVSEAAFGRPVLRVVLFSCAALFGFVGTQDSCHGQLPIHPPALQANKGPTTSPYLFLAQPGGNEALNYYRRVRPEQLFRAVDRAQSFSIHGLQGDVRRIDQALVQSTSTIGQTGHQAVFFHYGGYFGSDPAAHTRRRGR